MYSPLRLVTAAALIAFGAIIGVGVPVLLFSAVERPPVAGASGPGTAENGASKAGKVEVASAAGKADEQPLADSRPTAATVPPVSALQASTPQAPGPEAPAPQASTPQAPAQEASTPLASVPEASLPQAPAPQALAPPALAPQAPAPSEPVARGTAPQAMAQEPAQASVDAGAAAAGRGATAGRKARGQGTDRASRREESRPAGPDRKEALDRGLECRAEVRRHPERHSRQLLCRRRDAADHRDPADIDSGRVLLLRASVARSTPA